MKHYAIMLLVFLLVGFMWSCDDNDNDSDPTFELGNLFTLEFGASRQLENGDLTVTFSDILEDSRCPQGVNCIWEGRARIELTLSGTQTVELTAHAGDELAAKDTVDNFIFTLLEVLPYPVGGDTIAQRDYKIELQVDAL